MQKEVEVSMEIDKRMEGEREEDNMGSARDDWEI